MSSPVSLSVGQGFRPLKSMQHNAVKTGSTFTGSSQIAHKPKVTFGLGEVTPDEGVDEQIQRLKDERSLSMVQKASQMTVYLRDVRKGTLTESEKWAHMDKFLEAMPNLSEREKQGYRTAFRVVSLKQGDQEVYA